MSLNPTRRQMKAIHPAVMSHLPTARLLPLAAIAATAALLLPSPAPAATAVEAQTPLSAPVAYPDNSPKITEGPGAVAEAEADELQVEQNPEIQVNVQIEQNAEAQVNVQIEVNVEQEVQAHAEARAQVAAEPEAEQEPATEEETAAEGDD
jgi:pilus assembly protein FimV